MEIFEKGDLVVFVMPHMIDRVKAIMNCLHKYGTVIGYFETMFQEQLIPDLKNTFFPEYMYFENCASDNWNHFIQYFEKAKHTYPCYDSLCSKDSCSMFAMKHLKYSTIRAIVVRNVRQVLNFHRLFMPGGALFDLFALGTPPFRCLPMFAMSWDHPLDQKVMFHISEHGIFKMKK